MKTVLVPTDFSAAADNASHYALHLAKAMNANMKICIAVKGPSGAKPGSHIELKGKTTERMELLTRKLQEESYKSSADSYHPVIEYLGAAAPVSDAVASLVDELNINIAVMGVSGADGESLGSNSKAIIERGDMPLLLIPTKTRFKAIHRIGFGTELKTSDIALIKALSHLARQLNAEILIAHITDNKYDSNQHQHLIDAFLKEVANKVDYPKISYEHIKSMDVDRGLDWISEHGQIDMLVTVHHQHGLLGRLFNANHTERLANHIHLPLLVFPGHIDHTF